MSQGEKPTPQMASPEPLNELPGATPRTIPPKARKKNGRRGGETNGHGYEANGEALEVILDALQAMRSGDFSVRLPRDQDGLAGKIADTFNEIVAGNERMAEQLEEVGQVVGRDGETRKRVRIGL